MSNPEQDEAVEALRLQDGQQLLDRIAARDNVQSMTANNNALVQLLTSRAQLRMTLRRCAVFGCVLALGWSVYGWIVVR